MKKKLFFFALCFFLVMVAVATFSQSRFLVMAQTQNASLKFGSSLSTGLISLDAGNSYTASVVLNTGGNAISGVDVVINYDPALIDVVTVTPNKNTTFQTFLPIISSTNFAFDPTKAIKSASKTVEFGAAAFNPTTNTVTTPFSSTSDYTLATIGLIAKQVRRMKTLNLTFQYTAGSTTDSNVVWTGSATANPVDVLNSVGTAAIRIYPSPVCAAALAMDNVVGLNDLLFITGNQQYNKACSDCAEDLTRDGNLTLADLLYVTGYWEQTCTATN